MLEILVGYKGLPFSTVLMDSWYATNKIMLYIDDLGKYYYCPLKRNRLVDDTAKNEDYKKIESLSWEETELKDGKIIKIKRFPGSKKVKLFRVAVSTDSSGLYRYQRFISKFYGCCATGVQDSLED